MKVTHQLFLGLFAALISGCAASGGSKADQKSEALQLLSIVKIDKGVKDGKPPDDWIHTRNAAGNLLLTADLARSGGSIFGAGSGMSVGFGLTTALLGLMQTPPLEWSQTIVMIPMDQAKTVKDAVAQAQRLLMDAMTATVANDYEVIEGSRDSYSEFPDGSGQHKPGKYVAFISPSKGCPTTQPCELSVQGWGETWVDKAQRRVVKTDVPTFLGTGKVWAIMFSGLNIGPYPSSWVDIHTAYKETEAIERRFANNLPSNAFYLQGSCGPMPCSPTYRRLPRLINKDGSRYLIEGTGVMKVKDEPNWVPMGKK
jgi:hypothetical protein